MNRTGQRRDKLRRLMKKAGADAMLVTKVVNVTYLTGFTGDSSYLLITKDGELLISDSRFTIQIQEECPGLDVRIRPRSISLNQAVAEAVKKSKVGLVAIESTAMTVAAYRSLESELENAQVVETSGLVEQLREIKDKDEVAAIRRAVKLAERAIQVIRSLMVPEQTELEIAAELENQIRRFGGWGCSFEPIVAVGPRAALPHAPPTNRQVAESDFVLIDWGAKEKLYISDLTRVFATGRISPKLERVYGVVSKAQRRAIESIKPGVTMESVDRAARSIIEKAGFGKQFGHGLGHGIGLEVHEAPSLAARQKRLLKPGMVVTVEPGIYLPGWGGVRIEDDVLVTKDGHEVLSSYPKTLGECVIA